MIIDYRCGAGVSRFNWIRLVHPWGARTRGNGRQPEVTEHRFRAQDGGWGVITRGGLTVQLPPRARVTGPGLTIRGLVHLGQRGDAGGLECLAMFGCPRCCGVTS